MNTNAYSQAHHPQFQPGSINPAMLNAFQNQQAQGQQQGQGHPTANANAANLAQMGSAPEKYPGYGQQQHHQQSAGVNPMHLMGGGGGQNGMNANAQSGFGSGGGMGMGGFTGQMMAQQQQQTQAQMMGMGGGGMQSQQPQQQLMNGMGMQDGSSGNTSMSANGLMGSSSSTSGMGHSSNSSSSGMNHPGMNAHSTSASGSNHPSHPNPNPTNPMQGQQQQKSAASNALAQARNQEFMAALSLVGMTREQFATLTHQERQIVGGKAMQALAGMRQQQQAQQQSHQQHQQQQQHHGGGNLPNQQHQGQGQNSTFDPRPSSAASSHPNISHQQHMMQQQAQAQQQQHPSRPGTALSGIMTGRSQSPMPNQHHQRPPSSMSNRASVPPPSSDFDGGMNMGGGGYPEKPPTPGPRSASSYGAGFPSTPSNGFGPGPGAQGFPGQGQQGQEMPPGSPYRGAKQLQQQQRRVGSVPPGTPSMGPPAPLLNRQMSTGSNASGGDPMGMNMGVGGMMGGGGGGQNGYPPSNSGARPGTPSRAPTRGPMDMPLASPDMSRMNPAALLGMGAGPLSNGLMGDSGGMKPQAGFQQAQAGFQQQPQGFQQQQGHPPRNAGSIPPQSPLKTTMDLAGPKMGMGMGMGVPPTVAPVPITPGGIPPAVHPGVPPSHSGVPPSHPGVPPPHPGISPSSHPGIPPSLLSTASRPALASQRLPPSFDSTTTLITLVSPSSLPTLSTSEIADITAWRETDKGYDALHGVMKERMKGELRDTVGRVMWWERGSREPLTARRETFDVRYQGASRKREKDVGGKGKRREGLRIPRRLAAKDANRPERLVPIRLEFDADHQKMRDTFVWNLNDPIVTPDHFAQSLIEDYALPSSYRALVVRQIDEQLADYKLHSLLYDGESLELNNPDEEAPREGGALEEKDAEWWAEWRRKLMSEYVLGRRKRRGGAFGKGRKRQRMDGDEEGDSVVGTTTAGETEGDEEERALRVDEFQVLEGAEDLRILIRLDIMVGQMKLDDQFEWDLDNASPSPEQFAETYVRDLGLAGEFKTAVAHCIREQVQTYQKSLYLVGHPSDGTAVQDDDLRLSFLPAVSYAARPMDQVQSFTPQLAHLSDGEIDRTEKERDKDMMRRKKRNTRGRRGVALPDREPIRTYRTPAIGFPELSAAALALAVASNAPTSRRAAAAAASLTIASMVATENGDSHYTSSKPMSVSQPAPAAAAAAKEKKVKGFFKPPEFSRSGVIRPRAEVKAPTASTAGEATRGLSDFEPSGSTSMGAPISSRVIVTAKRQKELEREAKEREFADTQHENMIDGIWHCSNCGCPENIAVGRRKGPLGDKSQCGTCGKFWHRHRRPRPVEYNSALSYHIQLQKDAENAKSHPRRKRAPMSSGLASDPPTPRVPKVEEDDILKGPPSPMSSTSSLEEAPLAHRMKGANSTETSSVAPPSRRGASPPPPPATTTTSEAPPPGPVQSASSESVTKESAVPDDWLSNAMDVLHGRFPHDRFELTLRRPVPPATEQEWRIKCMDCPGKLYKPGPGETMSNFEVHLKNRLHRQRVSDRTAGSVNGAAAPPS